MQPPHLLSLSVLFWSFLSVFTPSSPWRHTANHWGRALVVFWLDGTDREFPPKDLRCSKLPLVTSFVLFSLDNPGSEVWCCLPVHNYAAEISSTICLEKCFTNLLLAPSHCLTDFQPHGQWSPASRLACGRTITLRDKEKDNDITIHPGMIGDMDLLYKKTRTHKHTHSFAKKGSQNRGALNPGRKSPLYPVRSIRVWLVSPY